MLLIPATSVHGVAVTAVQIEAPIVLMCVVVIEGALLAALKILCLLRSDIIGWGGVQDFIPVRRISSGDRWGRCNNSCRGIARKLAFLTRGHIRMSDIREVHGKGIRGVAKATPSQPFQMCRGCSYLRVSSYVYIASLFLQKFLDVVNFCHGSIVTDIPAGGLSGVHGPLNHCSVVTRFV